MKRTYSGHCSKCGAHIADSPSSRWFRCAACRAANPPNSKDTSPCTPEMAARIVALLLNEGGRSGCITSSDRIASNATLTRMRRERRHTTRGLEPR